MDDQDFLEPDQDLFEPLWIGCSRDDPFVAMHCEGQRHLYFSVQFEPLPGPEKDQDYRRCLEPLWAPFLLDAGLSAMICHRGWALESGKMPDVFGFAWRQVGTERFDSLSDLEIQQLIGLLRAAVPPVTDFFLEEKITTARRGSGVSVRRFRLDKGVFLEEAPPA